MIVVVLLHLASSQLLAAQGDALPEHARGLVTAAIQQLLRTEYVFDSTGERCADELGRMANADPRWRGLSSRQTYASYVGKALAGCANDAHLSIEVPAAAARGTSVAEASTRSLAEALRLRNFDAPMAARLPGNVGYLELRSFPPVEMAGETVAAAMTFLANTDAMIIDLRRNSGGTGDMVRFLASWFFDSQVTLLNTFRRADRSLTPERTLPYVPGKRRPRSPLFVLTSRGTFSAAEAFAFGLQQLERATIVGERTRGGANAGRYRAIGEGMQLFVPQANARAANSEKTWERVGVVPNIAASDTDALSVAHAAAVAVLLDSARSDPIRARELRWTLERLNSERAGVSIDEPTCRRLARAFEGDRLIRCRGNRLWYSRGGTAERSLAPLSATRFMIDGVDDAVLELTQTDGRWALTVSAADGTVETANEAAPPER